MERLRQALIRLAHEAPSVRAKVLPLVRQADKWNKLPNGWTQDSVESFWDTLTGNSKHKVTTCIERMSGKFDDPGAFCASLADKVMGPGWRKKKAVTSMYVPTKDMPAGVRAVLREVRYGKRDVRVEVRTKYSLQYPADDGMRGFTAAVNLESGRYKITWGSWGGANAFNPRNQVDLDNTERQIPLNGVIVQGEMGGRGTFLTIYVNPDNVQALLPAPAEDLSPKEQKALDIIGGLISSYRADEFAREGLGRYNAQNPLIQSLAAKGFLKVTVRGIAITTQGKNQRKRLASVHTAAEADDLPGGPGRDGQARPGLPLLLRERSPMSNVVRRIASRYMQRKASGTLQVLTQVFSPCSTYVKDYRRFVQALHKYLTTEWRHVHDWDTEFNSNPTGWTEVIVDEVETHRQTWWSPAEYAEIEEEVPEKGTLIVKTKDPNFIKTVLTELRSHITDARGMSDALELVVRNPKINAVFADIMEQMVEAFPHYTILGDDGGLLTDWINENTPAKADAPHTAFNLLKVKFECRFSGATFQARGQVQFEVDYSKVEITAPKYGY